MIHKELKDFKVVLLGDRSAQDISVKLEKMFRTKLFNLCGKTSLRDLIEILKKLSVFITPDTAPLHLAQSLNVKTIALFGPTNPDSHAVKSNNLEIVFKKMDCSFCYKTKCKKHECMESISSNEVFSLVKKLT